MMQFGDWPEKADQWEKELYKPTHKAGFISHSLNEDDRHSRVTVIHTNYITVGYFIKPSLRLIMT
jgi:hypothetical protein